nr:hypothetical protein HK105_000856 [Polyrhizophydium stewartii]
MAPSNEFVFTENSQNRAVGIVGSVRHEATVSPIQDADYLRVMKRRTERASVHSRGVKIVGTDVVRGDHQLREVGGRTWNADLKKKRTERTLDRRERMSRKDLHDILFPLFNEFQYWNLKGLVERTNQPQAWLKEVLAEVCILNRRGPYTGMYQLKPEFTAGGSGGAPGPSGK